MKQLEVGDNVKILCMCHKQVSNFMVESNSIYADQREVDLSLQVGYYVAVNSDMVYPWATCPCDRPDVPCPWKDKFSTTHGKTSVVYD